MSVLLNLAYLGLLLAASPWILWRAARQGKYREGLGAKLWGRVPVRTGDRPCVWFHAVSLGEVQLLSAPLAELMARRPEIDCVISTTTRTGFQAAQRFAADHTVCYCPLDFSWAVRTALRRIRPDVLVLAELELWPNLIRLAHRSGTKVAVINGRLSPKSFRNYLRIPTFMKWVLSHIQLIAVQSQTYADRFIALGARRSSVEVTGSIKFDGAETDRDNRHTTALRRLVGLTEDATVWLAGSTFPPEEKYVLAAFQVLVEEYPNLQLILVPRHPERFDEVAAMLATSGLTWARRSHFDDDAKSLPADWQVLLVDTIGELGAWWGTAQLGFVGGSMGPRGGQNMIEPAAYGVAVCFGPNTVNFREVTRQLQDVDAAVVVHDERQLIDFLRQGLSEPHFARQLGQRARELVLHNQGANRRTVALIESLIVDKNDAASPSLAWRQSA